MGVKVVKSQSSSSSSSESSSSSSEYIDDNKKEKTSKGKPKKGPSKKGQKSISSSKDVAPTPAKGVPAAVQEVHSNTNAVGNIAGNIAANHAADITSGPTTCVSVNNTNIAKTAAVSVEESNTSIVIPASVPFAPQANEIGKVILEPLG
jgi:hypothetical protein